MAVKSNIRKLTDIMNELKMDYVNLKVGSISILKNPLIF